MIQELIKKIEDSYYWDARVKSLDCNYFGDEVRLVFEDDKKYMDFKINMHTIELSIVCNKFNIC